MIDEKRPAIAERIRTLKPSATAEMSERVRAARAAGRKIISLASGDPNLVTDPRIVEAAEEAMRADRTHYSSPAGEVELREAIANREWQRAGAKYDVADILITPGGKFAVLSALMGTVGQGDEVIVPEPGWVSYGPCIRLCGGTPIAVAMLDRVESSVIERAITDKTRAIILNSPVNPTGRVISADEMRALIGIARQHDLWIIFDQVYSDLVYQGPFPYLQGLEGGAERTLVVDSLSKSFGMTGWRLGYLATPPGMAKSLVKFIQHSVYCVPAFVQAAGLRALSLASDLIPRHCEVFGRRAALAARALNGIDGISCAPPDATFYVFPRFSGDDTAIARRWLDELDVAAMPGSAFGGLGAGHLRLSLTCSDAELSDALERISRAGLTS